MSVNGKMTAIADAIRAKTGGTTLLGLDEMAASIEAVHAAGKKAEYDRFWDVFQDYGRRTGFAYAFAYTWTDEIFNPKYPIVSSSFNYTFYLSGITDTKVDITVTANNLTGTFQGCTNLKTIRKLTVNENMTYTAVFRGCSALENITVAGVIGNNFEIKDSPLTAASAKSIISALKDYAGTGEAYTCTLGAKTLAKLTDAEKAIATQKGWTLA